MRDVTELRRGDRFLWCDRTVTVLRVESRIIVTVDEAGVTRRLHYYANESVSESEDSDG
jgi:hypothetical protein